MEKGRIGQITGDIAGGASTAVYGLPGNIVFGLIAFAPLGDAYAGIGIMAAMYGTAIVCLLTSILGKAPGMISGPNAATSLIFASVITQTGILPHMAGQPAQNAAVLAALPFLAVLLSGILQVLLGLLRIGNIVKYIPHPVLAGILNGTVILIFLNQVWPLLGIENQASLLELWHMMPRALPLNTALAFFAGLIMYASPKVLPKIPGALVAIPLGSVLYHLLEKTGLAGMMGPVMGQVDFLPPSLDFARGMVSSVLDGVPMLAELLAAAATIAILNSLNTLLAVSAIQDHIHIRPENNRLMIAEGIGNMTSACLGGLSGAGYVLRSRMNNKAGGRTNLSGIIYALVVFGCIAFLSPLIGMIPKAVMTGVILIALASIFDKWSLALFKKFISGDPETRKHLAGSVCAVLLVMGICIFFNPVAAVLSGILLSVMLFIIEMNKSLIRREYRANTVHSKVFRYETYMDLLRQHGNRIAVMELEGPIFFGSANLLESKIEALGTDGADWILLDMKRVSNLDESGVRIIARTIQRMAEENRIVGISYARNGSYLRQSLQDAAPSEKVAGRIFFRDTEVALEYFEDILLDDVCPERISKTEFHLSSFSILQGLTARQIDIISTFLTFERFRKQEIVFRQGEQGTALYFIVSGSVDISLNITVDGVSEKKRLQIISAGTIFGEMALIDRQPRSAEVTARENLTCLKMDLDRFDEMTTRHPSIAIRVLTGISATLSERLRSSHALISELEM